MKKILVIEDNSDIRENISEILSLANYKVFSAENGKTGAEMAIREKPDLVICDIMMPVLDGYGVLHILQQNVDTAGIPFIFLTGKNERAEIRKGMELGADDYITKPFEVTELLHAVEFRLKKAEAVNGLASKSDTNLKGYVHVYYENEILRLLTENRGINKYKKKQVIYAEGNHANCLFYVWKGKVKTYKTNDDGKELVVGLFNEADFFGYVALLEGTTYKETAEAMESTDLAIIPKEDFDELIHTSREAALKFSAMLAQNITEYEEQMLGLAYNSLRKKVAEALVKLNKKYHSAINLSRENLAAVAGTATESLIRTLGDFRTEKLIDINGGVITILNERKLESLPN